MQRRHIKWLPILAAGLFLLYQYVTSEKFVNPETGRVSHVAMSTEQEAALGLQSYRQVLSQSRTIDSGPQLESVKRVASRLAAATGKAGGGFEWMVSLIDDAQQNAFCLPGGKIVVYTGIIPITRGEAGLATVLGHEMAHATSRHGAQRVLQQNSGADRDEWHCRFTFGHGLPATTHNHGRARSWCAIRHPDAFWTEG